MGKPRGLRTFLVQLNEVLRHRPPKKKTIHSDQEPKKRTPPLLIAKSIALESLTLLLLMLVLAAIGAPLLKLPGFAPGFDGPTHMYITQRLAEELAATGRLPAVDLLWYAGLEITHKLPPLPYIPMVIIYLFTGSPMLTSRIFYLLALGLMGLSMYAFMRVSGAGRINALAAALVVTFSGAGTSPFGIYGSFTRFFSFALFPWALYAAKRLMDGRLIHAMTLAVLISLMFPSHPMMSLVTIMWISVYAGFRIVLERKPIAVFKFFFLAYGFSVFLAAWYLGPFLMEEPVWGGTVPTSVLKYHSIPALNQLKYAGPVFLLAAFAALGLKFSRERLALMLTALFGFLFSLGVYGPLIKIFPVLTFAYPLFTFIPSVIALAYLLFSSWSLDDFRGSGYRIYLKKGGVLAGTGLLVAAILWQFNSYTDFTKFKTQKYSKDELALNAKLRTERGAGRVMVLGPPYGLEVHALPHQAKRPTPEGQYTSIAPFYLQVTQVYDDLLKGFPAAAREKLYRWNANYVVVTPFLKQKKDFQKRDFAQTLERGGFRQIYESRSFTLFKKTKPKMYIQEVSDKTLIVGKYGPVLSALYPASLVDQKSVFIDDYKPAELRDFKTLILYGFSFKNQVKAEALLNNYVRRGGHLVVNMQAPDEYAFGRNKTFLGVSVKHRKTFGRVKLLVSAKQLPGVKNVKPLRLPRGWQLLYYRGLDNVMLKAKIRQRRYALMGYKRIGDGKVLFFGGDLLFYAFNKHRADLARVIDKTLSSFAGKAVRLPPVGIEEERWAPEKITFSYSAKKPWRALISRTYSPHWSAAIGRRPVPVVKTEGMMTLSLPSGTHKVKLTYGATSIHTISTSVAALAWLAVGYMLFRWRKTQWRPRAKALPGARPGPRTEG